MKKAQVEEGSKLAVLGGDSDKMPRRKCSNYPSTWATRLGRGGKVSTPFAAPLPGTCHKNGLQPPRLSDGLTVGPERNPGVDAGRLDGREAGRLDMALW